MRDTLNDLKSAIEGGVGQFIVMWFILGGAATFGVVVFTAQYQWPGYLYIFIWIGLGILFSPLLFRNGTSRAV